MADEFIYTPITDLKHRMMRAIGRRHLPKVQSISVTGWPNAIAETPDEAIGKLVKVQDGHLEAKFSIDRVDGDQLFLRRVIDADYDHEDVRA
ncbi:hypothetical protein ACFSUK_28840 [Sphingobium scionense]|uniref:Uncharacterized protein n=1 Tax=Sphingobium scionense TaxID=1404341 RepID=A0A7W6LR00_9SPHN|nr:hypothetical protein [Sphingobium scionense]MBB4147983.1 hypothetical protein [Sphingobium scionense]